MTDLVEQEAKRIAYNERGRWWQSLSDSHRKALAKGTLSMMEEAFEAGAIAALRARATLSGSSSVKP